MFPDDLMEFPFLPGSRASTVAVMTIRIASKARRLVTTMLITSCFALGTGVLSAQSASAEPSARNSTFTSCPAVAATCTRYWSVDRTKEFNNEEKAFVTGEYAGSAGVASLIAVATGQPVIIGAVGAGDLFNTYKIAEFDAQLSSAANDHRCLIFKFPKGALATGWWGSVSPSTNEQCKKANAKDAGIFG